MKKRLLCLMPVIALVLAIVLSIIPATLVSADTDTFDGTTSDLTLGTLTLYDGMTYNGEWTATSRPSPVNANYLAVGQDYEWLGYDTYRIYRSYIFFDTSAIPDTATISSAYIKLYGAEDHSPGGWGYLIITEGMPTYPHDPVVSADYNKANYATTNLGSRSFSSMSFPGYNNINLGSAGLAEINKTGTTKFCLRSNQEIAGNTPNFEGGHPQWVSFYAADKGTGYKPQLVVTYTIAVSTPDVTTQDASDVQETSARLYAYVVDDGGEDCTGRFEYGLTAGYGSYTNWQSGLETDTAFSNVISGLTRGTIYHFKAVLSNSGGTDDGSDKTLLTRPAPPTSPGVVSSNQQNTISWTKGSGADKTRVYFRTDRYPTASLSGQTTDAITCDGTSIYFDTGVTYDHTSLTNGVTYYYLIISEVTSGGLTRYSTTAATTYGIPAAQTTPTVQTNAATGIGTSSATLNLYLSSLGGYGTTNVSFQYYKDGEAAWGESTTPVAKTEPTTYAEAIAGLDTSSLYHFRARATNGAGTVYGSSMDFTTGAAAQAPTMTTNAASNVLQTTATLNGIVTLDGTASVTAYFEWGITTAYGSQSATASGLSTGQPVYFNVDGLTAGTTYHYRIVGSNTYGTGYGGDVTFTTTAIGAPSVTTQSASSIGSESATLNGLLTSTGGAPSEVRFAWGDTSACAETTGWQPNKQTGDTFQAVLGGLVVGKTYYFKAQARNDGTNVYSGSVLTFTPAFGAPTGFYATTISSTTIDLKWTKAGDQTYVVMKPTGYPTDRADGTLVYSGTATTYSHYNLDPGNTYYYRAWSWLADGTFSAGYAETMATTFAAGAGEQERPDTVVAPDMPSFWFGSPNYTKQVNNPLYPTINNFADSLEMPRNTMWMLLVMGLSLLSGIIAYFVTHRSGTIAIIVVAAGFGFGGLMELIPVWMVVVFAVGAIGFTYLERRI